MKHAISVILVQTEEISRRYNKKGDITKAIGCNGATANLSVQLSYCGHARDSIYKAHTSSITGPNIDPKAQNPVEKSKNQSAAMVEAHHSKPILMLLATSTQDAGG